VIREFDKFGHIGLSCLLALGLGLLLLRWIPRSWPIVGPSIAWVLGFAEELRQRGVPGRDADFNDLLANTVGVLLALVVLQAVIARGRDSETLQIVKR